MSGIFWVATVLNVKSFQHMFFSLYFSFHIKHHLHLPVLKLKSQFRSPDPLWSGNQLDFADRCGYNRKIILCHHRQNKCHPGLDPGSYQRNPISPKLGE